jgi:hypothetical protein
MKKFEDFKAIWVMDFEYYGEDADPPNPVCYVAKELISGQIERQWITKCIKKPK